MHVYVYIHTYLYTDAAVEQMREYGAAADDYMFMSDPKTTAKKHPDLVAAEAEEAHYALPSDFEEQLWQVDVHGI